MPETGVANRLEQAGNIPTVTGSFALDTSAIMAFLEGEPGAERVEALLGAGHRGEVRIFAAFATRMELLYLVEQEKGPADLARLKGLMQFWPITWVHSDDGLCDSAASIKAKCRVSFADAFVAATAARMDATLVHRDPEFTPLTGWLAQEMLPPK